RGARYLDRARRRIPLRGLGRAAPGPERQREADEAQGERGAHAPSIAVRNSWGRRSTRGFTMRHTDYGIFAVRLVTRLLATATEVLLWERFARERVFASGPRGFRARLYGRRVLVRRRPGSIDASIDVPLRVCTPVVVTAFSRPRDLVERAIGVVLAEPGVRGALRSVELARDVVRLVFVAETPPDVIAGALARVSLVLTRADLLRRVAGASGPPFTA